mmetsp:Transcript_34799/g.48252  ORF Transcript_34799/g.48252 Transcript_34799/m.48252 type:complete len:842 (+) Transcript_34799:20-2545(+)|eukprot:CAMPEP_0196585238 /NCGR_PEP_ID=MMETSP1081-20130531/49975_1 /TAXON_ID=36882 /ORGANISM="Pyramimonas amylifera, Strain CCMP720" /LENGTH=841 /DNA_ID=CAMNT_0041906715 /DNA_START=87 /DNA_END=2612 /DNA_ORIENTATION=-
MPELNDVTSDLMEPPACLLGNPTTVFELEIVIPLLAHPDFRFKLQALEILSSSISLCVHLSPLHVNVIATCLKHENWKVKRAALLVLQSIGQTQKEADHNGTSQKEEKEENFTRMSYLGVEEQLVLNDRQQVQISEHMKDVFACLWDENTLVQCAAVECIQQFPTPSACFIFSMLESLKAENADFQTRKLFQLGYNFIAPFIETIASIGLMEIPREHFKLFLELSQFDNDDVAIRVNEVLVSAIELNYSTLSEYSMGVLCEPWRKHSQAWPESLTLRLQHRNESVRSSIALVLCELATDGSQAMFEIVEGMLSHWDKAVGAAAMEVLPTIWNFHGSAGVLAVKKLFTNLADSEDVYVVKALVAIGALADSRCAFQLSTSDVNVIIECLHHESWVVRDNALHIVFRLREHLTPVIAYSVATLLGDTQKHVRHSALKVVSQIQGYFNIPAQVIASFLSESNVDIQLVALSGLGMLAGSAAPFLDSIVTKLNSLHVEIRLCALSTLSRLNFHVQSKHVEPIVFMLLDPSADVSSKAIDVICELCTHFHAVQENVIETLISLLEYDDNHGKVFALRCLARGFQSSPQLLDPHLGLVINALGDESELFCVVAVEVLYKATDVLSHVDSIFMLTRKPQASIRNAALQVLLNVSRTQDCNMLFIHYSIQMVALLQSEDATTRKHALNLLGSLQSEDSSYCDKFAEMLQDSDPEVRKMAAWALGIMSNHVGQYLTEVVSVLVKDGDYDPCEDAFMAVTMKLILETSLTQQFIGIASALINQTEHSIQAISHLGTVLRHPHTQNQSFTHVRLAIQKLMEDCYYHEDRNIRLCARMCMYKDETVQLSLQII